LLQSRNQRENGEFETHRRVVGAVERFSARC
jgi:hypothetical protein